MSEKAANIPNVSIYAYMNSGVYRVNKVKSTGFHNGRHWSQTAILFSPAAAITEGIRTYEEQLGRNGRWDSHNDLITCNAKYVSKIMHAYYKKTIMVKIMLYFIRVITNERKLECVKKSMSRANIKRNIHLHPIVKSQ